MTKSRGILVWPPGTIPWREGAKVGYLIDPNGCWIWQGGTTPNGYAVVGIPGTNKTTHAHRIMFVRKYGEIPPKYDVDHLCRVRLCVNPDHMEAVPRVVNAYRGARVKRTIADVDAVNRLRAEGYTMPRIVETLGLPKHFVTSVVCRVQWTPERLALLRAFEIPRPPLPFDVEPLR